MRILLDECVDFGVCGFLRERRLEVFHVTETAWKGLSNSALYEQAHSSFDLFITSDRHFRNPRKVPPNPTMEILFIRIVPPTARTILPALAKLFDQVDINTLVGKYSVVRREGFEMF